MIAQKDSEFHVVISNEKMLSPYLIQLSPTGNTTDHIPLEILSSFGFYNNICPTSLTLTIFFRNSYSSSELFEFEATVVPF